MRSEWTPAHRAWRDRAPDAAFHGCNARRRCVSLPFSAHDLFHDVGNELPTFSPCRPLPPSLRTLPPASDSRGPPPLASLTRGALLIPHQLPRRAVVALVAHEGDVPVERLGLLEELVGLARVGSVVRSSSAASGRSLRARSNSPLSGCSRACSCAGADVRVTTSSAHRARCRGRRRPSRSAGPGSARSSSSQGSAPTYVKPRDLTGMLRYECTKSERTRMVTKD